MIYSDSQDWRLREGYVEVRTHRGWIRIGYRNNKHLHRYLYNNWKPSSELKLKLTDGKILVYLTLTKEFEVYYNPGNAVAVDINENNVTLAVFIDRRLHEIYRIESNIGRIVIAYSERRRRITEGRSTRDRVARKALRKLRERERKEDIIYKTAGIIEEIARKYSATVVVGNAHRGKSRMASKASKKNLRHRIHQWCASKLVETLSNKPLYVVEGSEAYSSSRDPFSGKPIKNYTPSVIRFVIDKDSVQATEKLYKATEEAVKTIAIALKPPEADEAAKRGRWTTGLLESAVVNIMRRLELDELYHWWGSAYRLCVDGFHEARFRSIDVILRLRDVEAVVNLAKKVLKMCSA